MKKLLLILLCLPLFFSSCSMQSQKDNELSKHQLNEINKRGLDIESLKTMDGKLNLMDGDGISYFSVFEGDYDDSTYLSDVYSSYSNKLLTPIYKADFSMTKERKERASKVKEYLITNINKEEIVEWEKKEWHYAKILIENIELWNYIDKLK